MNRIRDKIAAITGAGTGVGRACMSLFAAEGACVVGVGRTQATLNEALAGVVELGGKGISISADLAKEESAAMIISKTVDIYRRIDIVVHSAGVGHSWTEKSPESMNDIAHTTGEKWREVLALDLDSCFFICREAVRQFQKQGRGGSIVNVASKSGLQGLPVAHTYTAAKGAMINLTRSVCVAYARDGIGCNCVAPGYIATSMVKSLLGLFENPAMANRLTPSRRPAWPREIAYGCLYLASEEASYCNGTVLVIDGGTTARQ